MLLFPKTENVKISFAPTTANYAGSVITFIGIAAAILIWRKFYLLKKAFS